MTFSTRLKALRDELKLTQKEVADMLNLSQKTLSNYENGKREPDHDTLINMARVFDVSTDYLLGYSDSKKPFYKDATMVNESSASYTSLFPVSSMIKIPVLKSIKTKEPVFTIENIIDYVSLPSEELPQGEYFGYKVEGDSMNLSNIVDGCIVIIRKQDVIETGQIAMVVIDDQDTVINRFIDNGGSITLIPHSTDSSYLPRVIDLKKSTVRVIGRVVQAIIRY